MALYPWAIGHLGNDPTCAQSQLGQRGALLAAILEDYEMKWAAGEAIDLNEYVSLLKMNSGQLGGTRGSVPPRQSHAARRS